MIKSFAKKVIASAALALACTSSAFADPTFIGSWDLFNATGPDWSTGTVPTYTALEVAALLFGGSPNDYIISTQGSNAALIDNMAWLDQIYVGVAKLGEAIRVDSNGNGLYDIAGDTSAWVHDNACCGQFINYAFLKDQGGGGSVPEPSSVALLALGLGLGAGALRRARA